MNLKACAFSEKGPVRKENQDFLLMDIDGGFFAIADGMGGLDFGRQVSADTIRAVSDSVRSLHMPITNPEVFDQIYREVNSAIFEKYSSPHHKSGTTLTTLYIHENQAMISSIGDSRCYLIRDKLMRITEDQTLLAKLTKTRTDILYPSDVLAKYRHVLTDAIGIKSNIIIETRKIEVNVDDSFLLCTDGFYELFPDDEIASTILHNRFDPGEICKIFQDRSLQRRAFDNYSMIFVRAS